MPRVVRKRREIDNQCFRRRRRLWFVLTGGLWMLQSLAAEAAAEDANNSTPTQTCAGSSNSTEGDTTCIVASENNDGEDHLTASMEALKKRMDALMNFQEDNPTEEKEEAVMGVPTRPKREPIDDGQATYTLQDGRVIDKYNMTVQEEYLYWLEHGWDVLNDEPLDEQYDTMDDPNAVFAPEAEDWDEFFGGDDNGDDSGRYLVMDAIGCVYTDHINGTKRLSDRYDEIPYSQIPTFNGTWKYLNKKYHQLLEKENRNIPASETVRDWFADEYDLDEDYEQQNQMGGFRVPYTVQFSMNHGRGIFAAEDIKEGTLVWAPDNLATFDPEDDLRRFVDNILMDATLSPKQATNMACDVILWSYGRLKKGSILDFDSKQVVEERIDNDNDDDNGTDAANNSTTQNVTELVFDGVHCLRMDDGALFNHADPEDDKTHHKHNLVRKPLLDENLDPIGKDNFGCGHGFGFYALRDIARGEELRYNYDDEEANRVDVDEDEAGELIRELIVAEEKREREAAAMKTNEYKKYVRFEANPNPGDGGPAWVRVSDEWDAWYHNAIMEQSDLLYDLGCPRANVTHGIIDNFDEYGDYNGFDFYKGTMTPFDWDFMITHYKHITEQNPNQYTGIDRSFDLPKDKPYWERSGFEVPVQVLYDEVVGRKIITNELIKEGTLVYHPRNVAEFHPLEDFRKFVERLKDPEQQPIGHYMIEQNHACDAVLWAQVHLKDTYDRRDKMVCLPLDEGAFMNTGHTNRTANNLFKEALPDVEVDKSRLTCRDEGFYAKRDILPGEELKYAYEAFWDDPLVYRPKNEAWQDFLRTGGEEDLLNEQKKKPFLDELHCHEHAMPDFVYENEDWMDLFSYFTPHFQHMESRQAIKDEYGIGNTPKTVAYFDYPTHVPIEDEEDMDEEDLDYLKAMNVPIEIRYDEGQQRRVVYATEDISSGTLVWQPVRTVQFFPVLSFFRFLNGMLNAGEVSMICDVVDWLYNSHDGQMLCLDLDEKSMMKKVGRQDDPSRNLEWRKHDATASTLYAYDFGCQAGGNLYASRDISKGEELVYWWPDPVVTQQEDE